MLIPDKLMKWCIALLARILSSTYQEVRRVMKISLLSKVYEETSKIALSRKEKASAIHVEIIEGLSARALHEEWTLHQR